MMDPESDPVYGVVGKPRTPRNNKKTMKESDKKDKTKKESDKMDKTKKESDKMDKTKKESDKKKDKTTKESDKKKDKTTKESDKKKDKTTKESDKKDKTKKESDKKKDKTTKESDKKKDKTTEESDKKKDTTKKESDKKKDKTTKESDKKKDKTTEESDKTKRETERNKKNRNKNANEKRTNTNRRRKLRERGEDRHYGRFKCKLCHNKWESAHVYTVAGTMKVKYRQRCKTCHGDDAWMMPYKVDPLLCGGCQRPVTICKCVCQDCGKLWRRPRDRIPNQDDYCSCDREDVNRPHRGDLCQRCCMGKFCQREAVSVEYGYLVNEP